MYQSALLTNVNAKRINQPTNTSRATEAYEEPEFSYNDVLYDEMSRNVKRHKRNTSNNSRNGSANAATTPNTSSKISMFSNPMTSFSLGGTQSSSYMTSLSATNTSSNDLTKDDILNWVKKLIDEKTVVKGDANGDGKVDLNDLKVMVDRMFDDKVDIKMKNVDFDDDGKISLKDISKVIDILLEKGEPDDPVEPDPPPKQILKGDVNGDGKITQEDAKLISKYYVGDDVEIDMDNADIDDNGKITLADVSQVRQWANKFDPQILKGDANGDGIVNYKDVDALQRASINLGGKIDMEAADFDGDGEITSIDIAKTTKLANEYEAKFQKILGDSNGDGVVNEKDYANVKNYINNVNSSDDFVKKNSDINGDGNIDSKDLQGIRDALDGFNVNYSRTTLRGDVDGDGKVTKADAQLISDYNNRKATNKNFYINNADFNNDGKIDEKDAKAIKDNFIIKGDVNGDGKVTQEDAKLINRYYAGDNVEINMDNADINDDGRISLIDINKVQELADENDPKKFNINYSTDGHLGDVDGNGYIDMKDAVLLRNYVNNNVNTDKEIFINNADVNKDGKFGTDDVAAIAELLQNVRTVARELPVWSNVELTNQNGDVVRPGDNVLFLERENDSYKVQYTTASGEEKIGWVHRFVFDPEPTPIVPPWKKQAGENIPVYTEANLNSENRVNNETIYDGSKITVTAETDKAYQVEYSTSAGDKIGWISKTAKLENYDESYVFPDHVSEKGIALIKRFEGLRLTAYKALPSEEYYTIGYGHYGSDVTKGMTITEEQAESLLRQDLISAENSVKKYCSHLKLNQNQFDALVSFTFNCGAGNLQKLVRNNRSIEEIAASLPSYRTAGGKVVQGLVNRRAAELELFNTPISSTQNVQSSTSTTSQISNSLQELINKWDGKFWEDGYSRSKYAEKYLNSEAIECKEFASYIFNILYDTGYVGSGSTSSNYYNWRLNNMPNSIYQVAEVKPNFNKNSAKNEFRNLFEQAQPGDFIQIKRGKGNAHSAIFVGWTDDGKIQWLDANGTSEHNKIKLQTFSFDDLVKTTNSGHQWNVAMSLYRAK